MPLSYLVSVIPDLLILRFISLAPNYCSIDFSLPSVSLLICVGGRVIFLPSILAYTNFHFVYEMCLTKISSETELSEPNCPSMFC